MKKGIDISYHNGSIDFKKVKASGIEFIILRSSYRQTVDAKFHEYVKQIKEVGIPILGVYHFSYALNEAQAKKEAEFCIAQVEKAGLGKDTIIFFDFEYDTVTKAKNEGVVLGKTQCNAHTKVFCEYVKSKGYRVGVYSNIDYYKNWYDKDLLSNYLFWLADYSGGPDYACYIQQFSSSGKVNGMSGNVDMNYFYGEETLNMGKSRQSVVDVALSWEGWSEANGKHKKIVDIYNTYSPLPRGTRMQYDWPWCACTWSADAIKLGYTDIMPIEISCFYIIEAAKKMGCWVENDAYVPKPGDAVLYDWDDNGIGDNTGNPDHIGIIIEVHQSAGYMVIMEGNYSNAVKKRTLSINGRYIRGFITPKYDNNVIQPPAQMSGKSIKTVAHEVIAGTWGNGDARKTALESAGYNYSEVQNAVNQILNGSAATQDKPATTEKKEVTSTCKAQHFDKTLAGTYKVHASDGLYCRNDAGTNKKALCLIPDGTEVKCYGYYNKSGSTKWLYIQFKMGDVTYTGFSSSKYLKKK